MDAATIRTGEHARDLEPAAREAQHEDTAPESLQSCGQLVGCLHEDPQAPGIGSDRLLALQRTIGNRATAALLTPRHAPPEPLVGPAHATPRDWFVFEADLLPHGSDILAGGTSLQRSADTTVQRLDIPFGLLDRARGLLSGLSGIFSGGEGEADREEGRATRAGEQRGEQADTDVRRERSRGETDAQDLERRTASESRGPSRQGERAAQEAQREVGGFASMAGVIPAVVVPGARTAGGAAAGGGREAGGTRQRLESASRSGETALPDLDCDGAAVLEGIGRGAESLYTRVKRGVQRTVRERLAQLRQFAGDVGGWVLQRGADVADAVANGIERASAAVARVVDRVAQTLAGLAQRLRAGIDRLVSGIRATIGRIGNAAKRAWDGLVNGARRAFDRLVGAIRGRAGGTADRVRGLLSTVWSLVPGPIKTAITAVTSRIRQFVQRVREKAQQLAQGFQRAWDSLKARMRRGIELLQQKAREIWDGAKQAIQRGVDRVRQLKNAAVNGLRGTGRSLRARASRLVASTRAKVQRGRAQRERELLGEVCAPLGQAIGPCVDDMLPNLGPDSENELKFFVKGNVDIPVRVVNVRLGGGSEIAIKRVGDKFTVTLTGQGTLGLNVQANTSQGGGVGVEVNVPAGSSNSSDLVDAFKALSGESVDLASAKGRVEGGYRGTLTGTFEFNKGGDDDTCDGLGGMVTFLGGLGAAGVLPAPFNAMAHAGTVASFADRATSLRFRVADYVEAEGEASALGTVDLKGTALAERFAETELALNQQGGGATQSVTVGMSASVGVEGKAGLPGVARLVQGGFSGQHTTSLMLKLHYATMALDASELKMETKVTAAASTGIFQVLAAILPGSVVAQLRRRLDEVQAGVGGMFGVEVSVGTTVTGAEQILVNMVTEVRQYLEGAGSSATRSGVIAVVERLVEGVTLETSMVAKVFDLDRYSVKVSGTGGKGQGGAAIEAGVDHTRSTVIFRAGSKHTFGPSATSSSSSSGSGAGVGGNGATANPVPAATAPPQPAVQRSRAAGTSLPGPDLTGLQRRAGNRAIAVAIANGRDRALVGARDGDHGN
ncbi:MAG: hypothetical protein KY469_04600 [Actinobacteria bacterium]|nr:hypothetical protein [Actinomycetota bacterium]